MTQKEPNERLANLKIVESNEFACKAVCNVKSFWELYIIYAAFAQINQKDTDFREYTINVQELLTLIKRLRSEQTRMQDIKRQIIKAITCISVPDRKAVDTNPYAYPLVNFKYNTETGIIKTSIDHNLKKHFIGLTEKFVEIPLIEMLQIRSKSGCRLYEILMSHKYKARSVSISLKTLHKKLDTSKAYQKDFSHFRQKILEKAPEQLKNTGLSFEWEAVKNGRTVTAINFTISYENKDLSKNTAQPDLLEAPQNERQLLISDVLNYADDLEKMFNAELSSVSARSVESESVVSTSQKSRQSRRRVTR